MPPRPAPARPPPARPPPLPMPDRPPPMSLLRRPTWPAPRRHATRRCMARASSRRRPPRSALVWLALVPWSAAPAARTALSMWRLPAAPVLAPQDASLSLAVL
ncbi:MAG: hypothetical protein E5Y55_06690 [Mesorhizobium sp.]|nr:MAG: hypothetical protein E5Y55_06690 [Mesorhizobium sp.]